MNGGEKMFRNCLITFIVFQLGVFCGCATLEQIDGSPKEEIEKLRTTKDQVWNKMTGLEKENAGLKREINVTERETKSIQDRDRKKIADLELRHKLLDEQMKKLKETNRKIKSEKGALLKVLIGNNSLNSAREMAKKLSNMGYKIKLIDYTPTSNFSRNTIFYASGSKNEARQIASHLGGNTITKPISWYSIFDIIAVTGGNS
jgi:hypothetical protein